MSQTQTPRLDAPSAGRSDPNAKRNAAQSQADRSAKKGGGSVGYVLAGIIGGVIAAGGGYAAVSSGVLSLGGSEGDVHRMENRIVELERAVRSERNKNAASSIGAASPEVTNELRARLDGIVDAAHNLDETVRGLSSRLEGLERKDGDNGAQSAALVDITRRVAALEQSVETATKTQSERQVETRSAALTLALSNLKRAIAEGHPFAGELASVSNLAGLKLAVDQLAPFKDSGITPFIDLQNEFPALSRKAIEKHYRGTGGTLVGEVFSRAKAAIQVKSADGTGTTIEAIIGRMEAALKAANLHGVLIEGQTLQGPALDEMKPWLLKVEARAGAEDALRKTDQELLAALTRSNSRRP